MKTWNVQPNGEGKWEVKRQGGDRASGTFDTKAAARERGRQIAKNAGGSLRIKKQDGSIQEERTYGRDPYPPRG